jgi:Xaa-Pro aminopeptidase
LNGLLVSVLSPIIVTGRWQRALSLTRDRFGADSLIVTTPENIRWLTGFTGSAGLLVLIEGAAVLLTDGRYIEQAQAQLLQAQSDVLVVEARNAAAVLVEVEKTLGGIRSCGFDPTEITVRQFSEFNKIIKCLWVESPAVVAELRRIKNSSEIERIALASSIADAALEHCEPLLRQALTYPTTERDIRDELEMVMRKNGADGPSYETIVAAGPNSARPHHRPTTDRLLEGHSVVIDVGALVDGYHSDMTRTYLLGECDNELVKMHALVCQAQALGVDEIRNGVMASEVDRICRDVFVRNGVGAEFIHGTGHGVGLHIHEMPWLRKESTQPLEVGEVVTVEPGLYRVGLGGIRIEDLVLVQASGCHVFSKSQKEQLCLR